MSKNPFHARVISTPFVTSTTAWAGVALCLLLRPGLVFAQPTLQFRYTFEDTGTTTTTNDPGSALYPVPLKIVGGNGTSAINRHGGPGSGIQGQGQSLDLSTNPITGNANGAFAFVSNNATLGGLGIVTNFTACLWIKMPVLITNLNNQGSRLFCLMGNGIADIGGTNTLGMQFQLNTGGARTFPAVTLQGAVGASAKVTTPIYYNWPTNVWIFLAMTYDSVSGNECLYYGTEASPAKLYVAKNIGAGTNFNFSTGPGFSLGNRLSNGRSFPGWIDEARFYTGTGDAGFIESVRQSSTPVVVTGLVPDGSVLMSGTNTLTFTATSASGINSSGIKVAVNGTDVSPSLSFTPTAGGQVVTYNNLPVDPALPVQTNLNAVRLTIKVTDAAGIVATNSYLYDAFSPNHFTWEAEDYDFNSGSYSNNPDPPCAFNSSNPYYLAHGTPTIDYNDDGDGSGSPQVQVYRGISDLVATDYSLGNGTSGTSGSGAISIGELMRQKVLDAYSLDATVCDVNVGFFAGLSTTNSPPSPVPGTPNSLNFTRVYPTGVFNVYLRGALGNTTGASTLSLVTNGWGTSSPATELLGTFPEVNTGGWESYAWVPLKDTFGNLVQLTLSGTNTLQLTAGDPTHTGPAAGGNVNFLMLLPANTNVPAISNISPAGNAIFGSTNTLSFSVTAPLGVTTNNIVITLNGVRQTNLVFTGSSTSWIVAWPHLLPNTYYTLNITVTDVNGNVTVNKSAFDTFSPANYTWEGEDFDYNGGQYFDNPQTNAYFGLLALTNVDLTNYDTQGGLHWTPYRPNGQETETNGDILRPQYIATGFRDYSVGYFHTSEWLNYTRHFPAGTYNVYARMATALGATSFASLSLVTSGWGTTTQTTAPLGTFVVATNNSFETYGFYPLTDSSGNLANVTFNGSTNTLQLGRPSGPDINVNFLVLVPAFLTTITQNGTNINVSWPAQSGFDYQVQTKNNLTDSTWAPFGGPLNGTNAIISVSDSIVAGPRFYRVQVQ
jgi:hypothetical protein